MNSSVMFARYWQMCFFAVVTGGTIIAAIVFYTVTACTEITVVLPQLKYRGESPEESPDF